MSDSDDLERRLAAVERAVDGDGGDHTEDDDAAIETRLAALETRVDELDAAVQSIRGFLGGVSAVNEAVERRADAAVAGVERLERRLDGEAIDGPVGESTDGSMESSHDDGETVERSSGGASIQIPGDGGDGDGLGDRLRDLE